MEPLSDPVQEQAAILLSEGRYELGEICEKVGVSRVTLFRWRKDPEFAARVDEISREFAAAALKRGLARKEYRINTLANVHSKLLAVIEERAAAMGSSVKVDGEDGGGEDGAFPIIPGGSTGLMVKTYKVSGETVVTEYAVDTGLIREMRAIQEQVAKELGQLVEKKEMKVRSLKDLSDEELDAIASEFDEPQSTAGSSAEGDREEEEAEGAS